MTAIARRIAGRIVGGSHQALFALKPPLEVNGETHERVMVASAMGETHVFPVYGPIRVLGVVPSESIPDALKAVGYEKRGVA